MFLPFINYSLSLGILLGLTALSNKWVSTPQLPVHKFQLQADTLNRPEESRFTKTVLSNDLNEPMELAVAPDGRVFFVERAGKFYLYDPASKKTRLLYDFPAKAVDKYLNGLLGMTIDPHFSQNHYLYFFYTIQDKGSLAPPPGKPKTQLALTKTEVLVLRPTEILGSEAHELHVVSRQGKRLGSIHNQSYFVLKNITYQYSSKRCLSGVRFET